MAAQLDKPLTIAIDAMGGDRAPGIVLEGMELAHLRFPESRFLVFGDQDRIAEVLGNLETDMSACMEIVHTDDAVSNDDKPSKALRNRRQSSMRLAIDSVRDGRADFVVSAGNTGALMAMAKFALRTLPGIDRPAIVSFFPTQTGESVMLDLGANVECSPENLIQFALMGSLFAQTALNHANPRIGLLNIGSEDLKGRESLRIASGLLQKMKLPGKFEGFVEGDDILKGEIDVIVTDGFTGNVALKTAEGTAKFVGNLIRDTISKSWLAKIGFLFAANAFKKIRARIDPRKYNGAMFLGLQGVCIKSHGGTDEVGFANAIEVGINLVRNRLNEQIAQRLSDLHTQNGDMPDEDAESAQRKAS